MLTLLDSLRALGPGRQDRSTSGSLPHLRSRGAALALAGALAFGSLVSLPAAPARAEEPVVHSDKVDVPADDSGTKVEVDGASMNVVASLPQTSTDAFQLVGLTWTGHSGADVKVQFRTLTDGAWTDWQTTEGSQDEEAGRGGTEPIFVGTSSGLEARVVAPIGTTVSGVKASLINPEQVASDAIAPRMTRMALSSNYVAKPTIISRARWGADESLLSYNGSSCVPADLDTTVKAVIVHHTEGSNSYTREQSASILRGIYRYHVVDRGWCDIGYNMLVDKYGQVFEGRHGGIDYPVHGAHASSWNTNTFGISVMMNSKTAKVTEESMAALTQAIAWKLAGNYRTPLDTVTLAGKTINRIAMHMDVMNTDCPGTNLIALIPSLRTRVASMMGDRWKTEIHAQWQALGGESGSFGSPYILERDLLGGRVTDFTGGTIWKTSEGKLFWSNAAIASRARRAGYTTIGLPQSQPVKRGGGVVMPFANAEVHHSAKGAYLVDGAVRAWLRANPTKASRLGVAISDQIKGGSGWWSQKFEFGVVSVDPSGYVSINKPIRGDRNGDAYADAIVIDSTVNSLWWVPTQANTTAGTARAIGYRWNSFTWITQVPDTNGDGYTEIMGRTSDGVMWMYKSDGPGAFQAKQKIGSGWNGLRSLLLVDDVNDDGRPEVFGIDKDQRLLAYRFGSNGLLYGPTQVGRGWGVIKSISTVGNFTGRGGQDILAVRTTGEFMAYTVNAKYQVATPAKKVGQGWQGMDIVYSPGDLNGDGRRDLLARNASTGSVRPYLNMGGWWSGQPQYVAGAGYRLMA